MFCTNCGNEVHENAVACPKCGVPPRLENKACYGCGKELANPNQVICTHCGVAVGSQKRAAAYRDGKTSSGGRNKTTSGLFALLLGGWGAHKFYNGSWGWGIIYIVVTLTIYGAIITGIASWVQGIMFLAMDEDKYNEKYNLTPACPFKW